MKLCHLTCLGIFAVWCLSACATETAATGAPADAPPATPATTPSAAPPATPETGEDVAMSEVKEHHRHHHQGGITQFIAMSLDTLGSDEATHEQVEKIQSDLHACMAGARHAEKALLLAISDGIAAGTVDSAAVDPLLAQLETAANGAHFCSVSSLDALHAVLTPEERTALVDKVQAHWEVWRQVNHEAVPGGTEKGGRLAELASELSLSADQVQKMASALQAAHAARPHPFDPARAEAHLKAFTTAFASDVFDAKSIAENANGHIATHGAKRMVLFYETVTPLLTPEQRSTLAQHLKEHAGYHPAVSVR
jgi:Spy/CpxP family protein refolding chaperone